MEVTDQEVALQCDQRAGEYRNDKNRDSPYFSHHSIIEDPQIADTDTWDIVEGGRMSRMNMGLPPGKSQRC